MKILPSHKITGQLLDVILEAKKELVLVSPYVNFTYDKQLTAALTAARNRGVKIDFFIRDEDSNRLSKDQVADLGIVPRLVPNLHAKFYFNETTGIITSLNLLSSSIGNSIEIGCQLETAQEVDELRHFVQRFLVPHETGRPSATVAPLKQPHSRSTPARLSSLDKDERPLHFNPFGAILAQYLSDHADPRTSIDELPGGNLSIRAVGNTFTLSLGLLGIVMIAAVVSGAEADRFPRKAGQHFVSDTYSYQVHRGRRGEYDTIQATRKQSATVAQLDKLPAADKRRLLDEVTDFILAVQAYKSDWKT